MPVAQWKAWFKSDMKLNVELELQRYEVERASLQETMLQ
jgi:hypothetical protein